MPPIVGVVLSLAGPCLLGWLLVRTLWANAPRSLNFGLGAGLGMGATGTIYFLVLAVSDSARISLVTTEAAIAALIAILLVSRKSLPVRSKDLELSDASSGLLLSTIFVILCIVGGVTLFMYMDWESDGGWDAMAIWNLKARFIFFSESAPLVKIQNRALTGTWPDYPLLLPSLVARGWQYAGTSTSVVSKSIAALFGVSTFLALIGGVRVLCGRRQALIAGCLLIGTPFFVGHGVSQYADILIAFFMVSSVTLFSIYDAFPQFGSRLIFLAALPAGFAAATKNEGLMFVAVLAVARVLLGCSRGRFKALVPELAALITGVSGGLVAVAAYQSLYVTEANPLTVAFTLANFATHLLNFGEHATILGAYGRGFATFGAWVLCPLPFALAHLFAERKGVSLAGGTALWLTAGLVFLGVSSANYAVYLVTPFGLEAHLNSSLDRLLFQIWPVVLLLYSMWVSQRVVWEDRPWAPRAVLTYAAVPMVLIIALVGARAANRPPTPARPTLTLDRAETSRQSSYRLSVPAFAGKHIFIRYSIDGGPEETFEAMLDSSGSVRFDLSTSTPKGLYRFLHFRSEDESTWNPSNAALRVKE